MSIGSNIRSLREERGFTQEQVADKIGITFQAVSSWERDDSLLQPSDVSALLVMHFSTAVLNLSNSKGLMR